MFGCTSLKKTTITSDENLHDTLIHIAILDFSKKCNLFKKDSIFEIWLDDSVFHKTLGLYQIDEKTSAWKRGRLYDGIVSIIITAHRICVECEEYGLKFNDRYLFTTETTIGSKGKLPSRYIEKDNNLFYWWDDNYPLTEEMLAILWKYDLLFDDTKNLIKIPQFSTDDKQKGAHYYFCKNDLSKFKRVITSRGLGYYEPPKIKCE